MSKFAVRKHFARQFSNHWTHKRLCSQLKIRVACVKASEEVVNNGFFFAVRYFARFRAIQRGWGNTESKKGHFKVKLCAFFTGYLNEKRTLFLLFASYSVLGDREIENLVGSEIRLADQDTWSKALFQIIDHIPTSFPALSCTTLGTRLKIRVDVIDAINNWVSFSPSQNDNNF